MFKPVISRETLASPQQISGLGSQNAFLCPCIIVSFCPSVLVLFCPCVLVSLFSSVLVSSCPGETSSEYCSYSKVGRPAKNGQNTRMWLAASVLPRMHRSRLVRFCEIQISQNAFHLPNRLQRQRNSTTKFLKTNVIFPLVTECIFRTFSYLNTYKYI